MLIQLFGLSSGTWAQVGQYLPAGLSNSLASLNRVSAEAGSSLVTPAGGVGTETAVIGIALYTVLFVGLAILAFRRQDLTG